MNENKDCDSCGNEIPNSALRRMSDIDTYWCDDCETSEIQRAEAANGMTEERMEFLLAQYREAAEQTNTLDVGNPFLGDYIGLKIRAALSREDQNAFVWDIITQLPEGIVCDLGDQIRDEYFFEPVPS